MLVESCRERQGRENLSEEWKMFSQCFTNLKGVTAMKITTILVAIFLLAGVAGCGKQKMTLPTSQMLPAATGVAKVSKDENGNTRVNLKVEHFAPPQRLQPPKATYVVWVETADNKMYNLGQLRIKDNLKGELSGITPFQVFQIVITAEDYPTVTAPSNDVILKTSVVEQK